MRYLIVTALLVVATPAAASSDAEWTCDNGYRVQAGKGHMAVSFKLMDINRETPVRREIAAVREGARHINLAWRHGAVWLNGARCRQTN